VSRIITAGLAICIVVALVVTGSAARSLASGITPGTPAQVQALVTASLTITSLPSDLTPSLQDALNDPTSPMVDGANDILKSCNPYWEKREATAPVPCYYGDVHSHKIVVVWGDSNAGMWIPALSTIFKAYGYKLALFGFIGCDTSFLPETSAQGGYTGEWELCNKWHTNLPKAVRKLHPSIVLEASTPIRYGNAAYNTAWVQDMTLAFNELTKGSEAVRVEMGTIPEHTVAADQCLAANPSAVQSCDVTYSSPTSTYQGVLNRDALIAKDAHATLIPTSQWVCWNDTCSPVIGSYLAQLDMDHLSTPYVQYLTTVLQDELVAEKVLPKQT
jgi:hypothetical protein